MSKDKRLLEANKHMKQGIKLTTKGTFRWKLDYEGACSHFIQAARGFRNLFLFEQAVEAFQKAAEAYYKSDTPFAAGQALEDAGGILEKDLKQPTEAAKLFEQASNYFREAGKIEPAAKVVSRAAKLLEEIDFQKSAQLYLKSMEFFESEDKEHFGTDTFRRALLVMLKNECYEDALKVLDINMRMFEKLNQRNSLFKSYLSYIVILLYKNDYIAADEKQQKFLAAPGYVHSNEARTANQLLDAFENSDQGALDKVLKDQTFLYLEQPVARLSKKLRIPADGVVKREDQNIQLDAQEIGVDSLQQFERKGLFDSSSDDEKKDNDNQEQNEEIDALKSELFAKPKSTSQENNSNNNNNNNQQINSNQNNNIQEDLFEVDQKGDEFEDENDLL
ncbi:gamma-soluble nsf attachment protein [Anaeramoeba ignava]|uniref:Gamma-soluble NSF attachment protein n=1 Tax=Anaeramoeba ignava TaxID=1746090 RepID=A0A9Q0LI49_ANAIG|nr:gamma-soluble nsf attachment protein [Anaeramoeba ignava]